MAGRLKIDCKQMRWRTCLDNSRRSERMRGRSGALREESEGWTDDRRRQTRVRTRTASCRVLASGGRVREPPSGGGQQGEQSAMNWWVQLFFLSSALLQFTASYQFSLCILPLWSKKLGRILKCYFLERSHLDWLRNLIEVVMSLFCLLFTHE